MYTHTFPFASMPSQFIYYRGTMGVRTMRLALLREDKCCKIARRKLASVTMRVQLTKEESLTLPRFCYSAQMRRRRSAGSLPLTLRRS